MKEFDTAKVEEKIRSFVQADIGAPVDAVHCPTQEAKKGSVFECTTEFGGQTVRIRVTQKDAEGNADVAREDAIIDMKQAVALVQKSVSDATGGPVTADCGTQDYLVRAPGETFDCQTTSTASGEGYLATVTVTDIDGNVDIKAHRS